MGEAYLGRVRNALAKPILGRGEISSSESRLIFLLLSVLFQDVFVYEPLQTGLITIDSVSSIGCG